jgi:molybdopterin-binding protein
VLLLDEPFSALDPRNRATARRILRAIYYERRFTVLQVTHDFAEAGLLGDVAIMLDRGRVLQAGNPEQIFRKPASPYVADFLGAENVFAGVARPIKSEGMDWSDGDGDAFVEHAVAFTTGSLTFYALGDAEPGPAHAVIRAEEVALSMDAATSSMRNQFQGRVIELAPAGAITRVTVDVSGTPLVAAVTSRSARELGLAPGVNVVAAFKATAVHLC